MIDKLRELRQFATIGCVGGSDLNKIKEQITPERRFYLNTASIR